MKYLIFIPYFFVLCAGLKIRQNVQSIIQSYAVLNTLTKAMNNEIVNDSAIISQVNRVEYNHQVNIMYFCVFIFSLYLGYNNKNIEKKWQNLELFSKTQKNTRFMLLVFLFVFTKDIDNAI
jgi:hypothetical protein